MEKWKDVEDFNNYQVSNLGRIKNKVTGVIRKQVITARGYLSVHLVQSGKKKTFRTHRLVALAFIGINKYKPQVNHKNGIKTDNRASNLEWCTNRENILHAMKLGLHKPVVTDKCKIASYEKCCKGVRCINNSKIFNSSYDAARWLNDFKFKNTKKVNHLAGKIRECCNGGKYRKTAYGYKWKYIKQ